MGKHHKAEKMNLRALWPLLIPTLLLLPSIAAFPFPSAAAAYSDISISHYPNAIFLKQSILQWGQIPLWSPSILSGFPFAANPLSGLWYPLGWTALIFSLPLGFNLTVILHMLLGAAGMYLLIRGLGRSHLAALFGALAFQAMPKVFAHYGAGHLTMVYAISLTPWLLLAELRSWLKTGSYWLHQPGIFLALIALADVRWALYAGLFWLAFSLIGNAQPLQKKLATIAKQAFLAFALASPLLLPLFEYSQLATRANLAPNDVLAFSLPPAGLLGLLAPQFGGPHEWVIYVGVSVLFLATVHFGANDKSRLDWLWFVSTIGVIVFSMGEHIPGLLQLSQLPLLSLLRVPPRILPIAGISLIMLAAGSLDSFLKSSLDKKAWQRIRLALVSILGLQLGLTAIFWLQAGIASIAHVWAIAIAIVLFIVFSLFSKKRMSVAWFSFGILALTLVDLIVVDLTLFSQRNKEIVLAESSPAAAYLAEQPGPFRVYSPSYSIPQQTAAEYGLELADGVDPLQLQVYADFMDAATGVESIGYSITLPPFAGGDPANDNQQADPDLAKLALLNVGYMASEFEIDLEWLDFVDKFGSTYIYKLATTLPRAYFAGAADHTATITNWTSNRIEIEAEGPGRLVLSELHYPGWVAAVDGLPIAIEAYEGIFRSILLPEGSHQVTFEFHPLGIYIGMALSLAGVGSLFVLARRKK